MKVLIVDDSETGRKLLRLTLEADGHQIEEAADGLQALERLASSPFDAVISDILMPKMDGYRLCYEVRRSAELRDLPILIYSSTYTSPSDEALARRVGADKFLRKPASSAVILEALKEVIRGPRGRPEPGAPGSELEVLKQYSERLVRKLEDKNIELEAARDMLSATCDALRDSDKKFRDLVDLAPIGIFQTTPEGKFLSTNAAFREMLGYDSPEQMARLDLARDVSLEAPERRGILEEFDRSGRIRALEARLKRRDGAPVWVRADGRAVWDASGRIQRFEVFVADVTERRRAEEALRASEERHRLVMAKAQDAIFLVSREGMVLEANQAAERLVGLDREAIVGHSFLETVAPEEREEVLSRFQATQRRGHNQGEETWLIRGDGARVPVEVSASAMEIGGQALQLAIVRDVSERRRAEREIRRSEERFRRLFESNTIGIVIGGADGIVRETNDFYLNLVGYTREDLAAGLVRWDRLTPPEHLQRNQAADDQLRRTGVAAPFEKEYVVKDGRRVPVLVGMAALEESGDQSIAFVVDLTERKQLEAQLRMAQKMEAIGQLAGGIAHDFNNLLTAILGHSDLIAERLRGGDPTLVEGIDEIRKAGERAASLTRQLLAFSRRQVLEPKLLDLNDVVRNVEKMLRRLIGEDIELVTTLAPRCGTVLADAGQIEQVIMNLAVNARDAMPGGGRLAIETANVELDESYAHNHAVVAPGRYAMMAVSDTGLGMDKATKTHIFEPFFTTKEKGKGTGLGLSTVYGIIKQSGGYIWVYSEPGHGTTFKVYLPRVEESPQPLEARPVPAAAAAGGSETILLVEDEDALRALAHKILVSKGYRVIDASEGEQAVKAAKEIDGPVHLLLTDIVLPGMKGPDVAAKVREIHPEVRVLYTSGYTESVVVRQGLLEKGTAFLEKPFTPDRLARRVRRILDG